MVSPRRKYAAYDMVETLGIKNPFNTTTKLAGIG